MKRRNFKIEDLSQFDAADLFSPESGQSAWDYIAARLLG
jgi:hypothetical protein